MAMDGHRRVREPKKYSSAVIFFLTRERIPIAMRMASPVDRQLVRAGCLAAAENLLNQSVMDPQEFYRCDGTHRVHARLQVRNGAARLFGPSFD
ncbi:MAG: hypothetical protein BMS9Abin22_339 [Gammaproteobacteria bacterium]|nr:MAG: hypothetical protein BMS9Abin22_339 [Gammaproteobacteria bacterium]